MLTSYTITPKPHGHRRMFSPARSQSIAASLSRTQGTRPYTSAGAAEPNLKDEKEIRMADRTKSDEHRVHCFFPKDEWEKIVKRTSNLVSRTLH